MKPTLAACVLFIAATPAFADKPKQIKAPPAGFPNTLTVRVTFQPAQSNCVPGTAKFDGYTVPVTWNGAFWVGMSADGKIKTSVVYDIDHPTKLSISSAPLDGPFAAAPYTFSGTMDRATVTPEQTTPLIPTGVPNIIKAGYTPTYIYKITITP